MCGTINPPKNKFCVRCGNRLIIPQSCPKCGTQLEREIDYCPECGLEINTLRTPNPPPPPPLTTSVIKRLPFGLELLVAFAAIGALFYFASAVMAFWFSGAIIGRYMVSPDVAWLGVLWLAISFMEVTLAYGLWKLKEWARKTLIVLFVAGIIGAVSNPIYGITSIVYNCIVLWYLNTPKIRLLFQSNSAQSSTVNTFANESNLYSMLYVPTFFRTQKRVITSILAFIIIIVAFSLIANGIFDLIIRKNIAILSYPFYKYLSLDSVFPAVMAILLLGPILGLATSFIGMLISIYLTPIPFSVEYFVFRLLIVMAIVAAFYMTHKIVMRLRPLQVYITVKSIALSIGLAFALAFVNVVVILLAKDFYYNMDIRYLWFGLSTNVFGSFVISLYTVPAGAVLNYITANKRNLYR
ncbi:MAG: zinc ribbon domain-containing protein [Candidatus Bathyarchaeota archaeon]|nr:zinc ribbon domain-containing protein [Candidatus Bathyarchaeota archaeon]